MLHFSKFVEAVQILCSTHIPRSELNYVRQLLRSFVEEFEREYGREKMVFNNHLLLHIVDTVEKSGPLFCYSNYPFEDNMGHLLSFVHGTNDVILQIAQKYTMERILLHNLASSPLASKYYDQVQATQRFQFSEKIGNSHVIGKPIKHCTLKDEEISFIKNSLNLDHSVEIKEYKAVLLQSEIYYESLHPTNAKRTNDSFVCLLENNVFGNIKTIFAVNGKLYFFIHNMYDAEYRINLTGRCMMWLSEKSELNYFILDDMKQIEKYVFLSDGVECACVKIPNRYERN